jgi:serine/threonine protein kinase
MLYSLAVLHSVAKLRSKLFPHLLATEVVGTKSAILMWPAGLTSLRHSHIRNFDRFAVNACRWLFEVQQQLVLLHSKSLGHADVKPANIVVVPNDPQAKKLSLDKLHATLIDFEFLTDLSQDKHTSFSGTVRYSSRRILRSTLAKRTSMIEAFLYLAQDDFESLFYSACEILLGPLPWRNCEIDEALAKRNSWFNSKANFESYANQWSCSVDTFEFLEVACKRITTHPGQRLWVKAPTQQQQPLRSYHRASFPSGVQSSPVTPKPKTSSTSR